MIDLSQVSLALRNSTSHSLLILDEFGKGTTPKGWLPLRPPLSSVVHALVWTLHVDGAGLFCGVLRSLLDRGDSCPTVLATTHFHEIFRDDLLDPHKSPITFVHMEVMFTNTVGQVIDDQMLDDPSATDPSKIDSRDIVAGETITYLYRYVCLTSMTSSPVT